MAKNITFSANPALIEKARQKAAAQKKPLNIVFREWLQQYVGETAGAKSYEELMKSLSYVVPGKKFNRADMNER